MQRMNIATSCNDKYARYLFINLINAHDVLSSKYDVHYYIMHSSISDKNVEKIRAFAAELDLTVHLIHVENDGFLKEVAKHARAADCERFYDGACHLFLPDDVDRVLYVDTGDVLFTSAEYDFYNEDFNGKSLLVTTYWNLKKDRWDFDEFKGLWGGFNSGHMLINVSGMREKGLMPQDYVDYVTKWAAHFPDKEVVYGGDQAFLTAFFAGDIATIEKGNPYNVKVVALKGEQPKTKPKLIHMNGMFGNIKPWEVPFSKPEDLDKLKIVVPTGDSNQPSHDVFFAGYENECIVKWWDYCRDTPVYQELKQEAFESMKLLNLLSGHIRKREKEIASLLASSA